MSANPLISHVSDTARWVAVYRAQESERPDRIFNDPFARRLAGHRGEEIVRGLPMGRQMAWPLVVRTAVMDEIILRVIARDGVTKILNLAAGLDARPWRMILPPALEWTDVDHPEMIEYKRSALAAEKLRCRYEGVGLDLADAPARQALFARIGTTGGRVLVITEGLLVYLPAAAVEQLARDLHAEPSIALWLTDLASPGLLKMMGKRVGPVLKAGNAPFLFGPAEGTAFFAPFGWREVEWRSQMSEGLRLKRTFPLARMWALLARLAPKKRREEFRRFSGIALLDRAPR